MISMHVEKQCSSPLMLTNDSVSSEKSGHFFKERQLIKINISFSVRGTAVPVEQNSFLI